VINIVLSLYNLAWLAALFVLKRLPRVGLGWQQRTLKDVAEGPFDLWIQAASGGESMLTNMVLEGLGPLLPNKKIWRILVTSGTKQGIDSLGRGCRNLPPDSPLDLSIAYFPFDAPHLMDKAFARFKPKLAVIVETELWPGFLIRAKKNKVPVMIVNGRMSEKSFRSYKYFAKFFRQYGPEKVLAISPADRERFSRLVGPEKVSLMDNIKFDRICPRPGRPKNNPIGAHLPENSPFLLLGSIRREEEQQILHTVARILALRQDITVGLFPKHIERADHLIKMLTRQNIKAIKRSEILDRLSPGTVIVWDVFGELAGAYALAEAAFVGGALANLGGQNFLEPLAFGLKPIIGPHWHDFAWIGREIVAAGLVTEVADEVELTATLLTALNTAVVRDQVIKQVQDFLLPRTGGTHQVCQLIITKMAELEKIKKTE